MRPLKVKDLFSIVAVASVAYWVAAVFVRAALLNDLLDGALIVLATIVAYQVLHWSLANFNVVAERQMVVRAGIVLSWVGTGIWRLERFLMQEEAFGYRGPVGLHDPLRGYMMVLLIVGASYHITAYGMEEPGRTKAANLALVCAGICFGVVAVVGLRIIGD